MSGAGGPPPGVDPADPSFAGAAGEEELRAQRAAYEAELSRITVPDMLMQATVSLLNLAAHRLAPTPPVGEAAAPGGQDPSGAEGAAGGAEAPGVRDLEQVRDAIDGVRALLEILERRLPGELRPLRDALSQLQLAYASEVSSGAEAVAGAEGPAGATAEQPPARPGAATGAGAERAGQEEEREGPGPAESSGRLWVPGR